MVYGDPCKETIQLNEITVWVKEVARQYACYPGLVTSGAGGGYLVVASEKKIPGAIKIKVSI